MAQHPVVVLHLEEARDRRMLDFGCGRARFMLPLLAADFDVWGVDISERELGYARTALADAGRDPARVALIGPSGRSPFPDGEFGFVFSEEVFEHVADLDATVAEIARVTAPGGEGVHSFPAKWRLVESHFRAPFIHWLPKNNSRRAVIHLLNLVKPFRPPELPPDAPRRVRAEFKYRFSVEETFYRPHREIVAAFRRHGLEAESRLWEHPRLVGSERMRRLLDAPLRTFTREVIYTRKPHQGIP